MSIDGFPFEGRDVTARQLSKEMTAYGVGTLQSALEAGMQTRQDVIAFCERRVAEGKWNAGRSGRDAWKRVNGKSRTILAMEASGAGRP